MIEVINRSYYTNRGNKQQYKNLIYLGFIFFCHFRDKKKK